MIPVQELEKVVIPDRNIVTPIWEHMKKYLIPERDISRLFITFIIDIAWLLAPEMHCIMRALRSDSTHNVMQQYFTQKILFTVLPEDSRVL